MTSCIFPKLSFKCLLLNNFAVKWIVLNWFATGFCVNVVEPTHWLLFIINRLNLVIFTCCQMLYLCASSSVICVLLYLLSVCFFICYLCASLSVENGIVKCLICNRELRKTEKLQKLWLKGRGIIAVSKLWATVKPVDDEDNNLTEVYEQVKNVENLFENTPTNCRTLISKKIEYIYSKVWKI